MKTIPLASGVFLFACVLLSVAEAQTLSRIDVRVCPLMRTDRTQQVLHSAFAAQYYAAEYPLLNPIVDIMGTYESPASTPRGIVRAFVTNGTRCELVVGPGANALNIGLSPLITQLWIDYSASSTELTDRTLYPLYNRAVLNDADALVGPAVFAASLGWKRIQAICADTTAGRSIFQAFTKAFAARGGVTVPTGDCIQPTATKADIVAQMNTALASQATSRAVILLLSTADAAFNLAVQAAQETKIAEQMTIIFTASACSLATGVWTAIPGAICMSVGTPPELILSTPPTVHGTPIQSLTPCSGSGGPAATSTPSVQERTPSSLPT